MSGFAGLDEGVDADCHKDAAGDGHCPDHDGGVIAGLGGFGGEEFGEAAGESAEEAEGADEGGGVHGMFAESCVHGD